MARRPLRVGSTFSGVGGADLGLERAGFELAWTCEWDEWKRSVLAAHWPGVPHYFDVRDLADAVGGGGVSDSLLHQRQQDGGSSDQDPDVDSSVAERGFANVDPVDLLCGGFPCQDLSVAGKRRGFDGERSVLAFEFLRIAESIRPRWLLLENVPGLLSSNGGRDLARLLDEVGTAGYGWAYRVLDARYFGVPQRRRRVFIVARRADSQLDFGDASALALRALWEGGGGDPTPGWPPREITPSSIRGGAQGGCIYNRTAQFGQWPDESAARTLTQRDYKSPSHLVVRDDDPIAFGHTQGIDVQASSEVTPTLRKNGGGQGIPFRKSARPTSAQGYETWVDDGVANTLNRFDIGDIRSTHAVVAHGISAADPSVAGTLCTNSQGGQRTTDISGAYISQPMSVRRLTPVECERLMGWPDGWTAPPGVKAPDSKRYAACGDGIVSWVAYWIGCRIRMIEEQMICEASP